MEEENASLQHGRKKGLLQGGKGSEELKGGVCGEGFVYAVGGIWERPLQAWKVALLENSPSLELGDGGGSASFPDLHSHHTFPLAAGLLAVPSSL